MIFATNLPDWLVACFRIALLGEIYQDVRAIAVGYNESGELLIRYYLCRELVDFDWESIDVVAANVESIITEIHLSKIDVECVFTTFPQRDLDPLSGFIYARREVS